MKDLKANHPAVLAIFEVNKKERDHQFWQRDPLAVEMYDRFIFQQKLERAAFRYVHLNPLHARWNLADRPENYYWSSAKFYETGIDDFGFLTHYLERL